MTTPSQPTFLAVVYATDENIAVRAPDDYASLAVPSNLLASGTDGVFADDPWTLTSASVDFGSNGVSPQCVIWLQKGTPPFRGSGQLFAVETVVANSLTLRRIGQAAGIGQPPGVGGVTGIIFSILTFGPQIEEISFDLNRRYGIDPTIGSRSPGWVFDLRDLRRLCVLEVLADRLSFATRTDTGDWAVKLKQVQCEMNDLRARVAVRWGPVGSEQPPVGRFSTKLSR